MIETAMIEEIVERIKAFLHPEKIILFGSYGRGEANKDSDLDLLVVADVELSPRERFPAVSRLLADFSVPFDIIIKTPAEYQRSRSVVNHIVYFAEKYGKLLYER